MVGSPPRTNSARRRGILQRLSRPGRDGPELLPVKILRRAGECQEILPPAGAHSVVALSRHFQVSSRGELLAHCHRLARPAFRPRLLLASPDWVADTSATRSANARPGRVSTNPATSCGLGKPLRQPDNLSGRNSGMQAGGHTLAGFADIQSHRAEASPGWGEAGLPTSCPRPRPSPATTTRPWRAASGRRPRGRHRRGTPA
jgi:hypothetical protein